MSNTFPYIVITVAVDEDWDWEKIIEAFPELNTREFQNFYEKLIAGPNKGKTIIKNETKLSGGVSLAPLQRAMPASDKQRSLVCCTHR